MNSITTTVDRDQGSSVLFTREAEWLKNSIEDHDFCNFVSLDLESPENLTKQLGLSLEWEIDELGPFNSTEALTPALKQRGIFISTNCTFHAEQLFDILQGGENYCEDRIRNDLIPHCTSNISITRQIANRNVELQCSVRPLQCEDDNFRDTSRGVNLQLQGMTTHNLF